VEDLFNTKLKDDWWKPMFKTQVMIPLDIEPLFDRAVNNLSGGEL
jgi:translation initiation factor RLI1